VHKTKENTIIRTGKEEIKPSFPTEDMLVYIENLKESLNLAVLKSKFSRII
jgi:hypothetical protein